MEKETFEIDIIEKRNTGSRTDVLFVVYSDNIVVEGIIAEDIDTNIIHYQNLRDEGEFELRDVFERVYNTLTNDNVFKGIKIEDRCWINDFSQNGIIMGKINFKENKYLSTEFWNWFNLFLYHYSIDVDEMVYDIKYRQIDLDKVSFDASIKYYIRKHCETFVILAIFEIVKWDKYLVNMVERKVAETINHILDTYNLELDFKVEFNSNDLTFNVKLNKMKQDLEPIKLLR